MVGCTSDELNNSTDPSKKTVRDHIERIVERKIKEIVDKTKATHGKWVDPDFGPTDKDPLGALSLYGNEPPAPAGTNKYPEPSTMRWTRPCYEDTSFDKEDEEGDEEEEDEDDDEFGGVAANEEKVLLMYIHI